MLLDFKIDKAVSAAGFLIQRQGGRDQMFHLVKKLYYADRSALIQWGQSITGDKLASMNKGPIVSGIYDLMKGRGRPQDQQIWQQFIERNDNQMRLRQQPDLGPLSEREIEVLEQSRHTINSIKSTTIADWLHEHCPEWQNPGSSSIPIDPSTILRLANRSEEDIREIEEANEELRILHLLIGAH